MASTDELTPKPSSLQQPSAISPADGLIYSSGHHSRFIQCKYLPFSPDHASSSTNPSLEYIKSSGYQIENSCNGLMICSALDSSTCSMNYSVWNPTTNNFFTLPQPAYRFAFPRLNIHAFRRDFDLFDHRIDSEKLAYLQRPWIYLAYDPAKSPHYKVVCVELGHGYVIQIHIYSSETNLWRLSGEPLTTRIRFYNISECFNCYNPGVYWNGNIHWMSVMDTAYLYLDMEDEMLKTIPSPSVETIRDSPYYFGESCGHLHFTQILGMKFNVYELKTDYSGWFIRYRVDLSTILSPYVDPQNILVQALIRSKENDDSDSSFMILDVTAGVIIRYNLVPMTYEALQGFFEYSNRICYHRSMTRVLQYFEHRSSAV